MAQRPENGKLGSTAGARGGNEKGKGLKNERRERWESGLGGGKVVVERIVLEVTGRW